MKESAAFILISKRAESLTRCFFIIFYFLHACLVQGQNKPQLTEHFYRLNTASKALLGEETVPALFSTAMEKDGSDSLAPSTGALVTRKLFRESLIQKKTEEAFICFEPLFQFEGGRDFSDSLSLLYLNSRGVRVYGTFGKRFSFETGFLESQSVLPAHLRGAFKTWSVVPGYGRAKPFKTNGADFAMAWGSMKVRINSSVSLEAGHLRNFIGYGQRSLFLSDVGAFFPSVSCIIHRPKLTIRASYSALHDIFNGQAILNPLSEPIFRKKLFTWQYFEYRPHRRIAVSLYHAVVSTGPARWNLIPLPGAEAFENAQPNAMQGMYGVQLMLIPVKGMMLFSQFAYCGRPDFSNSMNNRSAYQGGVVYAFSKRLRGLSLGAEINSVMPLMYSDVGLKGGTGFFAANMPLGYARGTGIRELIVRVSYSYKRIFLEGSVHLAENRIPYPGLPEQGYDALYPIQRANIPVNPLIELPPAIHARMLADGRAGWRINPRTGLQVYGGLTLRSSSTGVGSVAMAYGGIGTRLFNRYSDL